MTRRSLASVAAVLLVAALTSCAQAPAAGPDNPPTPTITSQPSTMSAATAAPDQPASDQIVGTVVRFTSERTSIDVTIGEDSPAVRDFLSMLPLELTVEEFAGAEKIAYLPRELNYEGSPGSDPEDGDLIYYTSWGNLGFYYDTTGIGYSDATLHLGTYSATEEQLSLLEGAPVAIAIVD